jgi:DNA-binding transcriptional ArsR family regulator
LIFNLIMPKIAPQFAQMEKISFNQEVLDKASELLRAVSHQLRLSIIRLLDQKGEINVNQIYTSLRLEQSITSQHLKVLRTSEVVITRRDGKMIYYSLNYPRLEMVQKISSDIEQLTREKAKVRKAKVA